MPLAGTCAEASVSAPQSMAANITAAMVVVDMVYNILALGESTVRQVTFSTKTVNVRPAIQQKRRGGKRHESDGRRESLFGGAESYV